MTGVQTCALPILKKRYVQTSNWCFILFVSSHIVDNLFHCCSLSVRPIQFIYCCMIGMTSPNHFFNFVPNYLSTMYLYFTLPLSLVLNLLAGFLPPIPNSYSSHNWYKSLGFERNVEANGILLSSTIILVLLLLLSSFCCCRPRGAKKPLTT